MRTAPRCRLLIALVYIFLSCVNPAPGLALAQTDGAADDAAVRRIVSDYFAAYAAKDLQAVAGFWSEKSSEFEARRKALAQVFAAPGRFELRSLNVNKVAMGGDGARVSVVVELAASAAGTLSSEPGINRLNRILEFKRESGGWKVWRDFPAEEELAAALASAKTQEERASLVASSPQLVTKDLVGALLPLALKLRTQGNNAQAMPIYELARDIATKLGDKTGIARALTGIGNIYFNRGDLELALETYQKTLDIFQSLGDKAGIARVVGNMGMANRRQGNIQTALALLEKGVALSEEIGDKSTAAQTMNSIGGLYEVEGDYDRALEYFKRSLQIKMELKDRLNVAVALANIGQNYVERGNYAQGMQYYFDSMKAREGVEDRSGEYELLNNIGMVYKLQGNQELALDYFQKSLAVAQATDNKYGIGLVLSNIGTMYVSREEFTQALDYFRKALALREATGDKAGMALTLNQVGETYTKQNNFSAAMESLQKSLTLREQLKDRAGTVFTLNNIARLLLIQKEFRRALEAAQRSADTAEQINSLEGLWQARSVAGMAYRALNQPDEARRSFEKAITAVESMRAEVAGGEREEQRFLEDKIEPYEQMIELAVAASNSQDALTYAERARARVLLDVLQSGRVNVTKAMTPQERDQERRLNAEMVSLNTRIEYEKSRPQPDAARLKTLNEQLKNARLNYEAFQTNLYAAHPNLRVQRGQSRTLTLSDAAELVPDDKTALLEFALTESRAYLFLLTRESPRAPVTLKIYTLAVTGREIGERAEAFRQKLSRRDPDFNQSAQELYNMLLKPAREQLKARTSLVVVPDGELWDLPFQALQPAPNHYLVEDFALSYAPSLSVLLEMVRAASANLNRRPASSTLLAVGNPAVNKQTAALAQSVLTGQNLEPLPEAEKQVVELRQMYGTAQAKVYTGADAREEKVKAEAGNYRILQFATHGVLNDTSPMYSYVILSHADASGEDGLLEAWEMMNLDLHADLVVLSACETARGRASAGEGMIGMSWALFVAGSPTVVASQWKVESASTTRLMLEFHRTLKALRQSNGNRYSVARAMQQAALNLLRNDEYRHPFYWAGFVVMGSGN